VRKNLDTTNWYEFARAIVQKRKYQDYPDLEQGPDSFVGSVRRSGALPWLKLAGKFDWKHLDDEITPLDSDRSRPGIESLARLG
jgi:hypothetical protein